MCVSQSKMSPKSPLMNIVSIVSDIFYCCCKCIQIVRICGFLFHKSNTNHFIIIAVVVRTSLQKEKEEEKTLLNTSQILCDLTVL